VQQLPLSAIRTDDAFQPRLEHVLPYGVRISTQQRSDDHVAVMRLHLDASQAAELEPVLAANVGGQVFMVDGHHRLRAYEVAKRATIPARVSAMTRTDAVAASKLANCVPRSLPLMPAQRWEAAWQWMALVTDQWRMPLEKSHSYRAIGDRFGVNKDTIMAMVKRGPRISRERWEESECDPGTGFPRWDVVKRVEWKWKDDQEEITLDKANELRAQKLAAQIGYLMYGAGTDVRRRVWHMLAEDQRRWLEDAGFMRLAYPDADDLDLNPDF